MRMVRGYAQIFTFAHENRSILTFYLKLWYRNISFRKFTRFRWGFTSGSSSSSSTSSMCPAAWGLTFLPGQRNRNKKKQSFREKTKKEKTKKKRAMLIIYQVIMANGCVVDILVYWNYGNWDINSAVGNNSLWCPDTWFPALTMRVLNEAKQFYISLLYFKSECGTVQYHVNGNTSNNNKSGSCSNKSFSYQYI